MKQLKLLSAITALLIALPVSAHFIWLEKSDGQAKLYFGEYEGGMREKAGGRLDAIATPVATTLDNKALPIAAKRAENYIVIEGSADEPVLAHELGMKVKDLTKYHYGVVKPMYYARSGSGAAEAAAANHALDIQPLGNNRVRIQLNGKPLAKAKLKVIAPNQWLQELDADENGEVSYKMPWAGLYVLLSIHLEPNKGNYQGDAYEYIRHVSTYSMLKQ